MRFTVQIILLLGAFLSLCLCKEESTNEINLKSKNLDSNLRRALLKALTELENEQSGIKGDVKTNSNTENFVTKAEASAISIFQSESTEKSSKVDEELKEKKHYVVVQKSSGLQHKPITSFIPSNISEQFVGSASSSFNNIPRDIPKLNAKLTTVQKNDFTSPVPTVQTPTTEENEAKVEDVQFFSAPLVAAFTVHQDERGLPKSIEPIFKTTTQKPITTNFIDNDRYILQENLKNNQFKTQIALQEKQKLLEEQLYKLQRQQKEQQEFLYRQQQFIQDQQRRLLEERERNRLTRNEEPFRPITSERSTRNQNQIVSNQPNNINNQFFPNQFDITNNQPNQFSNQIQFQNQIRNNPQFIPQTPLQNSNVIFQSSVSLNPIDHQNKLNELPANAQHLPVKNFEEFRQTPFVDNFNSFNQLQSNLIPPQQNLFNFAQKEVSQQPQNIRVFRHEPPTGNFLNNYNAVNRPISYTIQPSVPLNVRLLRSNLEGYQTSPGLAAQPPVVNQQLQNLLFNAGISKGRQEDFNIVSKVLSFNHIGGNNFKYYTPIHRSDKKV